MKPRMRIIRVTKPLEKYSDFSHVPKFRMEAASDRGTRAHRLFSAYAKGLYIPKIDWDLTGYFQSYKTWYARYVVRALLVEERLTDDQVLGVSGQIDLIAELRDIYPDRNIIALLDDKTALQPSSTWQSQISAYWYGLALKLLPYGKQIEKAGTIRLNPDGKPAKVDWVGNPWKEFNAWLNAFYAYRHFVKEEKSDDRLQD